MCHSWHILVSYSYTLLHLVGVEVGEEGVAALFKAFHLLAHELAGEVVDGFCGGEIFGNLEVQLVGIVMNEFFALGDALAGAEFFAYQIYQPPVIVAKIASARDGVEIGVKVAKLEESRSQDRDCRPGHTSEKSFMICYSF